MIWRQTASLGLDDNDGLLDGVESDSGIFVNRDDPGSNPHEPDSDGDSFSDYLEAAFYTDPNDRRSTVTGSNIPKLVLIWDL